MTLIDEINNKVTFFKENQASLKEIFLYDFLNNTTSDIELLEGASTMDKICYAAFFQNEMDLSIEIEKVQKSCEIKGMHYTKNFIELVAMARHNFSFEKTNLLNYVSKCSLRENLIINELFDSINFDCRKEKVDKIDLLVKNIFCYNNYENLGNYSIQAIESADELMDFHIIKKSFDKAWSLHPNRELENDLKASILLHQRIKNRIFNQTEIASKAVILFTAIILISVIGYFLIKNWDKYGLEPYTIAFQIGIVIFSIVSTILLRKKIPTIKKSFDDYIKRKVSDRYFSQTGIIQSKMDKIQTKYLNN